MKIFFTTITLLAVASIYSIPKKTLIEEAQESSYYRYNKHSENLYRTTDEILNNDSLPWQKKRVALIGLVLAGADPGSTFRNRCSDWEHRIISCVIDQQDTQFARALFKLHPQLANNLFLYHNEWPYMRRPLWQARTASLAQAIIDFGGNVLTHGGAYNVPLHRAAYNSKFEAQLIPLYVHHGIDPNILNNNDETPLAALVANVWNYKKPGKLQFLPEDRISLFVDKLRLLIECGADATIKRYDKTPLKIFCENESRCPIETEIKNTIIELLAPA